MVAIRPRPPGRLPRPRRLALAFCGLPVLTLAGPARAADCLVSGVLCLAPTLTPGAAAPAVAATTTGVQVAPTGSGLTAAAGNTGSVLGAGPVSSGAAVSFGGLPPVGALRLTGSGPTDVVGTLAGGTGVKVGVPAVGTGVRVGVPAVGIVALGTPAADPSRGTGPAATPAGGGRRGIGLSGVGLSGGGAPAVVDPRIAALDHTALRLTVGPDGRTQSSVNLSSDAGGPVTIHNLGAGTAASDAANVGQVRASNAGTVRYDRKDGTRSNSITLEGGQPGGVTLRNVGPALRGTDAVNLNQMTASSGSTLSQANSYADARIDGLSAMTQQQIQQVQRDAWAGTASALAATGLRYDDRPGKTAISGAAAYYHDQAGLAFGLGHTAESGRFRVNAAVTVSPTSDRPEVGAVVGGSWTFN